MNRFDDLKLDAMRIGRDHLLVITGGEAHIGAVSTSFSAGGKRMVHTASVPGHKEHTISGDLAKRAAEQLNATVTLVMGIHYDHLYPDDIEEICRRSAELVEQYIRSFVIKKERSGNQLPIGP
ncbi:hypothetical protein [Paenibacillus caui]|uniref:prenylated flavin chaperone LpdD n=1 Tax=Paenibacillus caui TaxID=2873927 RepID=UPI001CA7BDE8|nr:hypothetical protein [Paenibacillus caui]